MDQTSMSENTQNKANTDNLDMSQHHSSSPRHSPGHSGAHYHPDSSHHRVAQHDGESRHHGTPHHHSGSHHSPEFQDNSSSYYSYPSHHYGEVHHHGRTNSPTSSGPGTSRGPVQSQKDSFNDEHYHNSRMHHSGSHHQDGSYHHTEPYHHGRLNYHGGSNRHDGPPHHFGSHHNVSPYHVGSHHSGSSHHIGSHHSGSSHHTGSHHSRSPHHIGSHHGTTTPHTGSHHSEYYHQSDSHPPGGSHYHSGPHPSGGSYHHGGPYYHGGPQNPHEDLPQHSYGGFYHHTKSSNHSGLHHDVSITGEDFHHGRYHHHEAHHHRRPQRHGETASHISSEESYSHGHNEHHRADYHPSEQHYGEHPHQREHHHSEHAHQRIHQHHRDYIHYGEHSSSLHPPDDLHSDHRYKEYHQSTSQLSVPHSLGKAPHSSAISLKPPRTSGMVHTKGSASSMSQTHSRVLSIGSQISNKVHPQDTSSKDSESWDEEDEQFQKRKTSRSQRAHKKLRSSPFISMLYEKLSYLIQGFRRMIWNLTHSWVFEAFIFFIICLNTVMLVAQTFAEVEIRGEWHFLALDCIFFCIYVVEALLKIIALGRSYFRDYWNDLDFLIMIMAMLDFLLMQFNSSSIYNQSLFRILKVCKSLRALRAIRVLRKFSILTSLQEVTGTLARTLPSITAILILMFTCLFLFSVVLRALFRKSDPKRFQSIFTTIFTLFTLLTLDDWSLIYMDSRAQGAWYIIPILMIYIIIQYFIFLNLVIAVLVDNFQMALLKGLEKVKQERAARIHEKLLEDSITDLRKAEPEEAMSEGTMRKQFIEKKFGTMTDKQQELLFHYLQLVAAVENQQQKFRSQASVADEIVDATFEVDQAG
ncbi:cation channel sperm-associated protein 1 [Nycticebus coucang]|uniref:cation channel sperm-associated protein 1 n=1 Tax=Nycticebus coucang TaxID=9470 RepID=UPI00234C8F9D|nr:cation channel sperm-associated protein 1 [Nycticebus coucang]